MRVVQIGEMFDVPAIVALRICDPSSCPDTLTPTPLPRAGEGLLMER